MARKNQFILRKNSSFNIEESTFVVQKYGELKHTTFVRRAFATKFHPKCPRKVPQLVQFERLLKRFEKTDDVHHTAPPGKASTLSVVDVREYFFDHPRALRAHFDHPSDVAYRLDWKKNIIRCPKTDISGYY